MQIHETVSIPKCGFKAKYRITATAAARSEKKNCLMDSPKNMDSVYCRISRLILTSIYRSFPRSFSLSRSTATIRRSIDAL